MTDQLQTAKNELRMMNHRSRKRLFVLAILLLTAYCLPLTIKAQTLDNMTADEDTRIRDAEGMDEKMNVYVRVVDRRFLALNDPNAAESKQAEKDFAEYGKLRTAAPAKLHADIARTIQEAIGKIDDVAERDHANPLFAKSVRILVKACERWTPMLKTSFDKATDDAEKIPIGNAVADCQSVIEASVKLPKEEKEKKKKSKDDSN
jgi:hypothetical protein